MKDREQVLQEHLEDLQIERDALLALARDLRKDLEKMTVDRDKWRHEHKLLAIAHGHTRKGYEEYKKQYKLDSPYDRHEHKSN